MKQKKLSKKKDKNLPVIKDASGKANQPSRGESLLTTVKNTNPVLREVFHDFKTIFSGGVR